jgi:hypothetical protein
LIELAVASFASPLVTRNPRDFFRAELQFPNLRCVDPAVFWKEITT